MLAWFQLLLAAVPAVLAAQVPFQAAPYIQEKDPLRLSHSGLYINQAHQPLSSQSSHSLPLTVYFDTALYDPSEASIKLSPIRKRSRNEVMLECGSSDGGIEACEVDDLASDQVGLECKVSSVTPDGRFSLSKCPGWSKYWSCAEALRNSREVLQSFTVTLTLGEEVQKWWIGELQLNKSRASWPLAGNARARRPGQQDRVWHEDNANRISGAMENPYIPAASRVPVGDPDLGVYKDQSSWSLGVQIRVPSGITNAANASAAFFLLEEVHAPVAGQVVWSRPYTFRKPPLVGPGAGVNDEPSHCLMIRDEWSIVYQIFGVDPSTISLSEGDMVARGDVLGHAVRDPLSPLPPSTDPPADHPEDKDDKHTPFYQYRYRQLSIRVSRPAPHWDEWKSPDEAGWLYFHPLHAFREGVDPQGAAYRSNVPPYGSPTTLYFAQECEGTPVAYASSDDFFAPTLTGSTRVFVGFESFQQTPGDAADGMDALGLYALELAITTSASVLECAKTPHWLPVFSHARLAPAASLWDYYVPAFTFGRFFPAKFTSQFDEKIRRLFYTTQARDFGQLRPGPPGRYRLLVRGRDYWGNVGCVASNVFIS